MVDQSNGRSSAPTLEEALALPCMVAGQVEPRFLDDNGHMNVAWYVHLFDQGTWELFRRLGMDDDYRTREKAGVFAVEQQVRHFGELREGDPLEVRSRLLDVRPKSLRVLHVMTDPVRRRVSAAGEVVGVHVDFGDRRARPFPPPLLARLEAEVARWGGAPLDEAAAQRFARAWIDAWNRRDVEAVLSHYVDDATFVSPKAEVIVGRGRLTDKADLRRYWQAALARTGTLRFVLDAAVWSPAAQTLTIVYTSHVDDQPPRRTVELVRFRGDRVIAGEALYGAEATW